MGKDSEKEVPEISTKGEDRSPSLHEEDRKAQIWDLKLKGLTQNAIARALNISHSTVHRDLKELGKRCRDELLQTDPATLIAENINWLNEMERIALYEIHSSSKKVEKKTDPKTGNVEEYEQIDPNKSRFHNAALKARQMKIQLMIDTGIIPTNDPSKLFNSLKQVEDAEDDLSKDTENRSQEEIEESIQKLLKGGRKL